MAWAGATAASGDGGRTGAARDATGPLRNRDTGASSGGCRRCYDALPLQLTRHGAGARRRSAMVLGADIRSFDSLTLSWE